MEISDSYFIRNTPEGKKISSLKFIGQSKQIEQLRFRLGHHESYFSFDEFNTSLGKVILNEAPLRMFFLNQGNGQEAVMDFDFFHHQNPLHDDSIVQNKTTIHLDEILNKIGL